MPGALFKIAAMARTKKQVIQARYNEQLERARRDFLRRTGKKIARGFDKTDEYKRIQRNERQALYRYRKARQREQITGGLNKVANEISRTDKRITDKTFTGRAAGIGEFTADIEIANELFFTALDGGGDVFTASFNMQEAQEAGEESKGVIKDYDGNTTVYTDPFQFERAIRNLIRQGEKKQSQTKVTINGKTVKNREGKGQTLAYPTLSYTILDTEDGEYHVVTGDFDEADFAAAAAESIELDL